MWYRAKRRSFILTIAMHQKVKHYLSAVKSLFPKNFDKSYVLDVGCADINGNFRDMFTNCHYIGIDLWPAENVDVVVNVNDYKPDRKFDTVFSVEMLEHDKTRRESLKTMYGLLKQWGLLVVTAAWISRREHGTKDRGPSDSPMTNDYYRNIDSQDILEIFPDASIEEDDDRSDIRFYVIKK